MVRKGRYQKLKPQSTGYKKGYRYIDYGEKMADPIRFLKRTPKALKKPKKKTTKSRRK